MRSVHSQTTKFLNYCLFKPLFAVQPHTGTNSRVRRVQVQFARNEDSNERQPVKTPSTDTRVHHYGNCSVKSTNIFLQLYPPQTQYKIPTARRNTKNFSPSVFLDHCQKFYFFTRWGERTELNYCTSPQLTTLLRLKRAQILKKEENFDHHKGKKVSGRATRSFLEKVFPSLHEHIQELTILSSENGDGEGIKQESRKGEEKYP